MTEAEVIEILGVPAGVYTDLENYYRPQSGPHGKLTVRDCLELDAAIPDRKVSYGDSVWITLDFTPDGKVAHKQRNSTDCIGFVCLRGWLHEIFP